MKRASPWLTIRYHMRAVYRAILSVWYGWLDRVVDWVWGEPEIRLITNEPRAIRPRVACYPTCGPAGEGQRLDVRVVIATDKDGNEIAPKSEAVDEYLWRIETHLPPLPLHRHT